MSTRSTLTRASLGLGEATVHELRHSMKGPRCWEIPRDCTLTEINSHAFECYRNGATSSGWTGERGVT